MFQATFPKSFRYHAQTKNNQPYSSSPVPGPRLKLNSLEVDYLDVVISATGSIAGGNNFDILNANTINLNNNINFGSGALLNSNYGTTLFSDVSFNISNFFTVDASNGITSFNFYDNNTSTMTSTIKIEGPTGSISGIKVFSTDFTDSTSTPGSVTINTIRGRSTIPAGNSSITITNNKCLSTSSVFVNISSNDATAILKNVTNTTGSFTIRLNANCTANTNVDFFIVN
jgi:hypothetical protein